MNVNAIGIGDVVGAIGTVLALGLLVTSAYKAGTGADFAPFLLIGLGILLLLLVVWK